MNPYILALVVLVSLFLVLIAGLLVWAFWWPVGDECQPECCADDCHPCLKEFPHE